MTQYKYVNKNGEFTHINMIMPDGSEEMVSKQDVIDSIWPRIRKSAVRFDAMTKGNITFYLPAKYRKSQDLE